MDNPFLTPDDSSDHVDLTLFKDLDMQIIAGVPAPPIGLQNAPSGHPLLTQNYPELLDDLCRQVLAIDVVNLYSRCTAILEMLESNISQIQDLETVSPTIAGTVRSKSTVVNSHVTDVLDRVHDLLTKYSQLLSVIADMRLQIEIRMNEEPSSELTLWSKENEPSIDVAWRHIAELNSIAEHNSQVIKEFLNYYYESIEDMEKRLNDNGIDNP